MKYVVIIMCLINLQACTCKLQKPRTLAKNAKIYPNPADDVLFLDYNLYNAGTITFFNPNGVQVQQIALPTGFGTHTISVASLADGIYVYKLQFSSVDTAIGKLIITH